MAGGNVISLNYQNPAGIMIFTPTLKRKRGASTKVRLDPLPHYTTDESPSGVFTGFSVEVNVPEHIRLLYDSGCFGKGSKSRSCPEFMKQHDVSGKPNENLVLDLEESFFLTCYLKVLRIEDISGATLTKEQLLTKFCKVKNNFIDSLVAYLYLKSKNWIIKSGTKFGGNFLIYKKGMRFYHASFIVFINRGEAQLSKDIKGLQRIAETSDKDLLFLEISPPANECEDPLMNLQNYTVSENIIKRFNYSGFVQSK